MESVWDGFESVFLLHHLYLFYPEKIMNYFLCEGFKVTITHMFQPHYIVIYMMIYDLTPSLTNLTLISSHLIARLGHTKFKKKNIQVDSVSEKSKMVRNLLEILVSFDETQKGLFLKFISGSSRLPVGGISFKNPPQWYASIPLTFDNTKPRFKNLLPRLRVEPKMMKENQDPDNYLPTAITYTHCLQLPDYTRLDIMREKLLIAINEDCKTFHLY